MFNRLALLATTGVLFSMGTAPIALADPPPPDPAVAPIGDAGPPPDNGIVASSEPGTVTTPDGWTLTVVASNETQLPVAPLTTALSSREYLSAARSAAPSPARAKPSSPVECSRRVIRSAAVSSSARCVSSARPVSTSTSESV